MGISQWPNSPKYTDVWVINHLCLHTIMRYTFEVSYFALDVWRVAPSGLNAPQLIMFTFCKWILDWYIYLYDDYFNMSGFIHFSFQACHEGKNAAFAGASPLEFNTWSLCHILSASHDIGNYSALACTVPGRLTGCYSLAAGCHIQIEVN